MLVEKVFFLQKNNNFQIKTNNLVKRVILFYISANLFNVCINKRHLDFHIYFFLKNFQILNSLVDLWILLGTHFDIFL